MDLWDLFDWNSFYSAPSSPPPAAPEKEKELFSPALRELFLSLLPDDTAPRVRRELVEREAWYVPLNPDGSLQTAVVKPGRYRLAFGKEPPRTTTGSIKKGGKGGLMLAVHARQPPEGDFSRLDGRALVRSLPEGLEGLLLHHPDQAPVELRADSFPELVTLADAWELERLVAQPAHDELPRLLKATWYAGVEGGRPKVTSSMDDGWLVEAFTHPDRGLGLSTAALQPFSGEELFRQVLELPEVDGVVVNRYHEFGPPGSRIRAVALSLATLEGALRGEDRRPGAQPLPARSPQEVERWLIDRRFPRAGFRLVDAPLPDGTLLRGLSPAPSPWRMQETMTDQSPGPDPTWSPVFRLEPGTDDVSGFGVGPTRILCPGLLARAMGAGGMDAKDPTAWKPGRALLLGRLLSDWDCKFAAERLALAEELARLLPEGADRIPRTEFRTVEGAYFIREHPFAATREWIEVRIRHLRQFNRRWVWGL